MAMYLLAEAEGTTALNQVKSGLLAVLDGLQRSGYGNAKVVVAPQYWTGAPRLPGPKIVGDKPVIWWPYDSYQAIKTAWQASAAAKMLFVPFPLEASIEPGEALREVVDPLRQAKAVTTALLLAPSVNAVRSSTDRLIHLVEGTSWTTTVGSFMKKALIVGAIGAGVYYGHTRGWFRTAYRAIKKPSQGARA